ncbi:hypothetical protein SLE2022_131340 [Rubroshorea leprosula]
MGGKKKNNSTIENASEEGKLVWTPIMDEALMDAFLHQHNLGNTVHVWDALIKVNKDAKEWTTKPLLHYDTFLILFGNDRVIGEKSEIAKELKKKQSSQHDNESHNTIKEIDHIVSQNQVSLDGFGTNNVDFDPLTCLGAINNIARALSEGNSHPPLLEAEVWNMLEDLGLNSDQITTTYLYLLEHPDKLRAVLGCPLGRRLDIVMRVVFGTS